MLVSANATARDFEKRFDDTIRGGIFSVSNSLITCDSADTRCAGAQDFTGSVYQNGPFNMVNIDIDSDSSTFNSSSADLQLPVGSIVVHAHLYWSGQYTDNGASHKFFPPPNPTDKNEILFQVPGGSYEVVKGDVDDDGQGFYQGRADVTSLIAGSGFYTVANAQLTTGKQMFGGWSLVVVVKSQTQPLRRVVLWDGFLRHETGSLNVNLKDTLGMRRAESSVEMDLIRYDGDKGNYDSMLIDGKLFIPKNPYPTTDPAAAGDLANSSITRFGKRFEDRKPFYKNTLGYDADLFQIYSILNSDTDLELEFKTNGDIIHTGVISVQSDVEDRFVQSDWGDGINGTSSSLMNGETGFSATTGHMFHDTVAGALHAVQFSYSYDGQRYEVAPVRNNRTGNKYYNRWRSAASIYPHGECLGTKYWLYREVDTSLVSWIFGAGRVGEARPTCDADVKTQFAITGGATLVRSDDGGETTLTESDHNWNGDNRDGAVIELIGREFKIEGDPITTTTAGLFHYAYLDMNDTVVEYDLNSTKTWAFESDFDGRVESKIFDGLIPRGFGNLDITKSETNSSVSEVFFRTGDSVVDVQSKSWEGPFLDGDLLGNTTTNNHQFFQYAIVTQLTDPANNAVESEITFEEISFDLYGIAIPIVNGTGVGTWKRIDDDDVEIADLFSKSSTVENIDRTNVIAPSFELDTNVSSGLDPSLASESTCSTGYGSTTLFPLLILGMFWRRRDRT